MIKNVLSSSLSLTPRAAPRARGGNMICIASGRGNIGKSWIAITLAGLLAQKNKKILLFDGDLGLTNIDRQLGILPPSLLDEVLLNRAPLNTIITDRGFDVIAGRSPQMSLPGMKAGALELIKDDLLLLGAHYEAVVTDLGSNISKSVRFFTGNIGTLLLVVSQDQASLINAAVLVKQLADTDKSADIRLIVNDVSSKDEGEQIYQTALKAIQKTTALEPPLAGVILTDKHISQAIAAKKPVLQAFPDSRAIQDVQTILDNLE